MKDRIIKFINTEGISATRFADEIGVQRSSISHILAGRNNPSFEFIQKMLNRYRNLNAEWLIQGSGPMFKKSDPINSPETEIHKTDAAMNQLNLFNSVSELKPKSSGEDPKSNSVFLENKTETSRKVEKIMLFYSDKTFDEFFPSK